MTRHQRPVRRPFGIAVALGAMLALGGCETLGEAFSGVNPIAKELDQSATKGAGDGRTAKLAIPPGYGQRPTAGKAAGGDTRKPGDAPKAGAGKAPEKVGDPKKIDLKTGTTGETTEGRTLNTNRRIVREDRVETRGKEIVNEGDPSKGEKELLKPSKKKS
ncbi:MAG: hypothetical protein F4160_08670 [Rhodospirillaceae bacterium]|nr:hypothetical protein [Rhodospirillaceae bacterium]MYF85119.1 hypothetical protein [Rhodospirillaceae bacterium]MYH36859.1 hypothetical protein [Rhodospirillaceae bacterium]MYK12673.1 hypothetical protein [Rhodospirillaceae bacterium]